MADWLKVTLNLCPLAICQQCYCMDHHCCDPRTGTPSVRGSSDGPRREGISEKRNSLGTSPGLPQPACTPCARGTSGVGFATLLSPTLCTLRASLGSCTGASISAHQRFSMFFFFSVVEVSYLGEALGKRCGLELEAKPCLKKRSRTSLGPCLGRKTGKLLTDLTKALGGRPEQRRHWVGAPGCGCTGLHVGGGQQSGVGSDCCSCSRQPLLRPRLWATAIASMQPDCCPPPPACGPVRLRPGALVW